MMLYCYFFLQYFSFNKTKLIFLCVCVFNAGKPSSDIGTPIQRQHSNTTSPFSSSNGPKIIPHNSSASSLSGSHQKISFPILTPLQKKLQHQKEDGKRIVLQIKHGNSTTMEKSPDGKSKVVNGNISKFPWQPKSGLVPYNDDSDSEQENCNTAGLTGSPNRTPEKPAFDNTAGHAAQTHSVQASGDASSSGVKKIHSPSSNGPGDSLTNKDNTNSNKKEKHSSPFVRTDDSSKPVIPVKTTSHQSSDKENSCDNHSSSTSPKNSSLSSKTKLEDKMSIAKQSLSALELPSCSTGSSKVKSTTGNWCVQPQDGAPSPRGSCSSTNSVNSTSEWTVETKGWNFFLFIIKLKTVLIIYALLLSFYT